MDTMRQSAPYPEALADLVGRLRYKPRWVFSLADLDRSQGSVGLTLCVQITEPDTYHPDVPRPVMHYLPVPPAAYDERSWRRWLFEQILLVERHEAMEFFVVDGERPFAPHHGPGNDCYAIFEHGTDVDVRTSFRGEVKT